MALVVNDRVMRKHFREDEPKLLGTIINAECRRQTNIHGVIHIYRVKWDDGRIEGWYFENGLVKI